MNAHPASRTPKLRRSRTSPTVVDLFAGAGLFSDAFHRHGFSIVRAIELDPWAARTYSANVGPHVLVGDVRAIRAQGRADVLIAGPPCQGFSTLGKRDERDPRNFLSLEVVRWARALRPSVIVIENVAAFLTSAVWRLLAERLGKLGYEVQAGLHNALEHGVAQNRLRSFTVASMRGPVVIRPAKRRGHQAMTVRAALDGLPALPDGRNLHVAPVPSKIALARMKVISPGGDKRDVMRRAPHLAPASWWQLRCQVTDAWGRMNWDEPSNTLRTALQNASKGRYIHPEQHRVISLREAARLHSIPDDWVLFGYPIHIARQIGNSVPPLLGGAVAGAVRELF